MTILPKETIKVIAQSIGINNLPDEVAATLAPDVEYRMREIMQEAIKCMIHSKRTILTTDDVNSALQLRNIEPLYGFASGGPLRFKRALGHSDLFYIDDGEVELKEVVQTPHNGTATSEPAVHTPHNSTDCTITPRHNVGGTQG